MIPVTIPARTGYATIPCCVLDDDTLATGAKMVYLALTSFAGCKEIRPSHETIGRLASMSARSASTHLNTLRDRGLVEWKTVPSGSGKINVYRVLSPWIGDPEGTEIFAGPQGGVRKKTTEGTEIFSDEVTNEVTKKEHMTAAPPLVLVSDPTEDPTTSILDASFDEFWGLYPAKRRVNKQGCKVKFARALKRGVPPATIIEGLRRRKAWWALKGTAEEYQTTSIVWLNQNRWEDEIEVAQPRRLESNDWYGR